MNTDKSYIHQRLFSFYVLYKELQLIKHIHTYAPEYYIGYTEKKLNHNGYIYSISALLYSIHTSYITKPFKKNYI
jgi:hypothetical protein